MKLTKEQMKDEIRKCGADPIYFLKNYVRITHPLKGLIPFTTYDYQDDLLKDFNDHRFNIVLKARQLGISTIVAGYAAWLLLFRREKQVLVVATKFKTAGNLVIKVKKMIKSVPDWLRISEIKVDNQASFELQNGSKIQASTTSQNDAGRSEALSLLIVDEAAFVDGMDALWTGVKPTIATGGRCIALSTPNGVGNWFYKAYTEAEAGLNDFNAITLPWNVHPDRDPAWFIDETRNMARREIAQEYECHRPNTRIITPLGFTAISNIKIGDEVLTHKGRFKKVTRLFNKFVNKENLISISTPMDRKNPIEMTKEHPILTAVRKHENTLSIFNEIEMGSFNEEWLSTEQIKNKFPTDKNSRSIPQYMNALLPKLSETVFLDTTRKFDLSFFNIHTEMNDTLLRYFRQKQSTKRFIDLDYDTGKMIGLYLSEGFTDGKQTVFSFHKDENDLMLFVENWANKYSIRNRRNIRKYSNCTTVHLANKFISLFFKDFTTGISCYDKLLSKKIYDCSKDFIKGVVDGVWLGDGLHLPDKKNVLGLTNENLIYQIRTLMTSFDLITRISYVDQKEDTRNNKRRYYLELNNVDGRNIQDCTSNGIKYKNGQRTKFAKNKWWGRSTISEFKSDDDLVQVFNIEVEEDNSYIAENLVVHNCSFNMSGETVVNPDDMERLKKSTTEPKHKTGFDRNYWIWEEAKPGASYLVSADVARGDGNDYSTFHVLRIDTMEQVAEYQGKPNPDMFAILLNNVGKEYGNCLMIVENNMNGFMIIDKLIGMEYPNLYWSTKGDHAYIDQFTAETSESGVVAGFTTTTKTRPLIIAKMEEFVRNNIIKLNSSRLVHELETFVWNNGKPEALRSYNDDLVLALSIGCWVRDTALTTNKREAAYTKALLGAMVKTNTSMHTKIPGMSGYNQKTAIDPYEKDIKNSYGAFPWLYKG